MVENKKIKHLKRVELLEILVSLSEENETLKAENASLREKLNSKEIKLSEAGSIAEAAISVNGVFESAQLAAEQYLENIRNLSANAQTTADILLAETNRKCESMKQQAQAEVDAKWEELSMRIEKYCELHDELCSVIPSLHRSANEIRGTEE